MNNTLRHLIYERVTNHSQMMMARIDKLIDEVDEPSEKELLENHHKSYHAVAVMLLSEFNDFESYKQEVEKRVKVIYDNHMEMKSVFTDGRTNVNKFLNTENPRHYSEVIAKIEQESNDILDIIENGRTVSDFKKLDGFRDKVERVVIVSGRNKSYKNGKFDQESFLKGCAWYMWLENEEMFTKLLSYYYVDNKKLSDTRQRVLEAFYNYFKDNPELLKVED